MNILAVIPARSGSKSVKNKNIRLIDGKPMLAYSIEHALKSRLINRVILSTDSEKYAEIGRQFGAEVPFIRPAEFATDTSLDIDVFRHALLWLKENENYEADIVVQLATAIIGLISHMLIEPIVPIILCLALKSGMITEQFRVELLQRCRLA